MAKTVLLSNAQIRQFWSLVDIGEPDDCWPWIGNVGRGGYGRFRIGASKVGAHRVALSLEGPPQPLAPNDHALHGDCSDRLCCNPRHLRWGSNEENIADMLRLGRQAKGVGSGRNRLTEEVVRYVRDSNELGVALAKKFGVSTALISLVRNRKVWAHLP